MVETRHPPSPLWLRILAGAVIASMAAGLAYAVAVALLRFPDIGV